MRKITANFITALERRTGASWGEGNTMYLPSAGDVRLHTNVIIRKINCGSPNGVEYSFAGYQTAVTLSRLNAALSVFSPEHKLAFRGSKIVLQRFVDGLVAAERVIDKDEWFTTACTRLVRVGDALVDGPLSGKEFCAKLAAEAKAAHDAARLIAC